MLDLNTSGTWVHEAAAASRLSGYQSWQLIATASERSD